MTADQINYILSTKGFSIDKWTTLYSADKANNGIGVIALYGDNVLTIAPDSVQYYFNYNEEILYVQRYGGRPTLEADGIHSVPVEYKGKTYYFAPQRGQILDSELGPIAECISFSNICAIYDRNHSVYTAF